MVLDFKDALPYFLDEISDNVLHLFSPFVKHPSLSEPSLPQSLKLIVAAIDSYFTDFLFLSLICLIPPFASRWLLRFNGSLVKTFSSQEAPALITVLEDIIAPCVVAPLNIESDWSDLCHSTILAYHSLTSIAPFYLFFVRSPING